MLKDVEYSCKLCRALLDDKTVVRAVPPEGAVCMLCGGTAFSVHFAGSFPTVQGGRFAVSNEHLQAFVLGLVELMLSSTPGGASE